MGPRELGIPITWKPQLYPMEYHMEMVDAYGSISRDKYSWHHIILQHLPCSQGLPPHDGSSCRGRPWEQGYNFSCQGKGYTDKHYSNSSLQRCYIWQKHYLHVVQHLVFISTDDHTTIWPWFDSSSVGGTLLALVPFCQLQFFPTPTSSSFVFHGRNVTWQSSQNVNWCFGLAIED